MINALRYEPRSHRQRFETREQQRGEQQEQDWHLHLHFHLNLSFRAQKAHLIPPQRDVYHEHLLRSARCHGNAPWDLPLQPAHPECSYP